MQLNLGKQRHILHLVSLLLIAFGGILLWSQLDGVSLSEIERILGYLGFSAPFILLPYGLSLMLDVLGWRQCMSTSGFLSLRSLFAIRVSTDAVMNTIPAGVAVAEPMRVMFLNKRLGLPLREAVSATILSKMNVAIAQMLFVLAGVAVVLLYSAHHEGIAGLLEAAGGLAVVIPAAVVVILIISIPYSGPRLTQLLVVMQRIPLSAIRNRLLRIEETLCEIDRNIGAFARIHSGSFITALIYFFWSWLLLAAETWLLLYLLGVEISMMQALVFEGLASIVKLLFFFIPSGLGAQDLSFVAMLFAFGVPEAAAVAVAFILLRRGKEVFWALTGFILLATLRSSLRNTSTNENRTPVGEVAL